MDKKAMMALRNAVMGEMPMKPKEKAEPKPKAKSKSKKHPGFDAVQRKISKSEGVSMDAAGAILASSSRKASAKAKAKNPALKKVKGK